MTPVGPAPAPLRVRFYDKGQVIGEAIGASLAEAFKIAERPLSEGGLGLEGPHNAMVMRAECGGPCEDQSQSSH